MRWLKPLLTVVVLVLISSVLGVYNGVEIRKRVYPQKLKTYLTSYYPHHLVSRIVVMQPGSQLYNIEVLERLDRLSSFHDNVLNRYLYKNLISSLTDEQLSAVVLKIPFAQRKTFLPLYSRAANYLMRSVETKENAYSEKHQLQSLIEIISGDDALQPLYNHLISSKLEDIMSPFYFELMIASMVKNDHPKWNLLTDRYMSASIDASSKKAIYRKVSRYARPDASLFAFMKRLADDAGLPPDERLLFLMRVIALHPHDKKIISEFRRVVTAIPSTSDEYDWELGDSSWAQSYSRQLDENIAEEVFERVIFLSRDINHEVTASAFHWILDRNPEKAVSIYRQIVGDQDSSLRKAMIVLLARHDVSIPVGSIDWAFVGSHPRQTFFWHNYAYVYGSAATALYEKLSGHDYLGTGKRLPLKKTASVQQWKEFIDTYPWHPGTDDAYLQLMSIYFHEANFSEFWWIVNQYGSRVLADRDSDEYVAFMVREALLLDNDYATRSSFHRSAGTLLRNPIGQIMLNGPDSRLLSSLRWLQREKNRKYLALINEDARTIEVYINTLNDYSNLASSAKFEFVEDIQPSQFYSLFYGVKAPRNVDVSQSESLRRARLLARASLAAWDREWQQADFFGRSLYKPLAYWIVKHGHSSEMAILFKPVLGRHYNLLANVELERISDWRYRRLVENIHRTLGK